MVLRKNNVEQGVAPVVGFLLIIAILFLAAGQYQVNVVPEQEQSQESDHFSTVTEDFSGLRSSIIQASSTGQMQTQEFQIGMSYDVFGISQPAVSGVLSYQPANSDIEIRNAENNQEADNFWRGDVNRTYETGFLSYDVNYNRFQTHYDIFLEHGHLYGDYIRGIDDEIQYIEQSPQPIVDGRSITLYTMQANDLIVSQPGETTIEANPVSAPMNSVSISNFGDNPLEIKLPTRLDLENWEDILSDELVENEGSSAYIEDIRESETANDAIVLEFTEGESYNLRMSRIDLNSQDRQSGLDTTSPEYIAVETGSANIREETQISLSAEVRDKYNNGVIGIPVEVEAQEDNTQQCIGDFEGDSGLSPNCDNQQNTRQPGLDVSNSDGEVTYNYQAPEIENDQEVTFIYTMDDD